MCTLESSPRPTRHSEGKSLSYGFERIAVISAFLWLSFLIFAPVGPALGFETLDPAGARHGSGINLDVPSGPLEFETGDFDREPMGVLQPIAGVARIEFSVQSEFPLWGVAIEAVSLDGPSGPIPLDRLLVRLDEAGGTLASFSEPRPLCLGVAGSADIRTIHLEIHPDWTDPVGELRAEIVLHPFLPLGGELDGSTPFSLESQAIGQPWSIPIVFENLEEIVVEVSDDTMTFTGVSGPGTYYADRNIFVTVTTNSTAWHVDCVLALLEEGGRTIPADQICWERLSGPGSEPPEGCLGSSPTVLAGSGSVVAAELQYSAIVTYMEAAGTYQGSFTMVGSAD